MRMIALNKERLWRPRLIQNLPAGQDVVPANTIVQLWLSLTDGGPPIDATKIVNLAQNATNPKLWYGTSPMADVNSQLGALAGGTILYVVISVGGEIDSAPLQLQRVSPIG